MGQRGTQDWSRVAAPLGTVRIRKHSKRCRVRMVKVRDDGPKGRRWITLARHWWLANRGPIPPGLRVVHRNGDVLDDRPENYILASGGDVAYLARLWDPQVEARCERRRLPAIRQHNRLRSRITRALRALPGSWYAVDDGRREIINAPQRSRIAILRCWLGREVETLNGAGIFGAWLGWPGLSDLDAFVLDSVAAANLSFAELVERVADRRRLFGLTPPKAGTFYGATGRLKAAGLLDVVRVPGRLGREYRITEAGLLARRRPCPWIPCLGKDLARLFGGYRRTRPEPGQLVLLAQGMHDG